MEDFSKFLPEYGAKEMVKPAGQLPAAATGVPQGSLPQVMLFGFGKMGIPPGKQYGSRFDFKLSVKEKYILRKRHWLLASTHNAVLKAVKKVELTVKVKDPTKELTPAEKKCKERMEMFVRDGFGSDGEKEFRANMVDVKKWNGTTWAEIVFDAATKEPRLVKYLMAETMWIRPDETGQILSFPQVVDGKLAYDFSPENIIQLKEHEDEYSFFGYSDVDSLYTALLTDALAEEFDANTLQNYAMAPGVLSFEDENISDDDLMRLRWNFIIQHQQNPTKPIFLNKRVQWLPMNFDLKNVDIMQLRRFIWERVRSMYGVLPMQAAVVETGKLANPDQQLEIGSEYIRQEMQLLEAAYNLKLAPHFKDSENLMFAFGDVDPKPEEARKEAELLKVKADAAKVLSTIPGAYTVNEIRAITGHDETIGGDVPVPQNSPPTPFFSDGAGTSNPQDQQDDSLKKEAEKSGMVLKEYLQTPKGKLIVEELKFIATHKASRAENTRKYEASLLSAHSKFSKAAIKKARETHVPAKGAKTPSVFEAAIAGVAAILKSDMEKSVKLHSTSAYRDAKTALGGTFGKPDEKAILVLVNSTGGPLDASRDFSQAQKEGFVQVMKDAYENGLDTRKMVKEMQNFSDAEAYKLERIARTETNRFSNQGRFAGYKELEQRRGEEYEYEVVGSSDDRQCEECADITSKTYGNLDDAMSALNGGTVHCNCRCNIIRMVK